MSKAERDAFYAKEALEFEKVYKNAPPESTLYLPMTKAGFELLLAAVCEYAEIPADDGCRSTLAGYVHHIAPDKNTTTIDEMAVILHKSISNAMTWQIDQEVKERNRAEEEAKPALAVVDPSPDGQPPQGA